MVAAIQSTVGLNRTKTLGASPICKPELGHWSSPALRLELNHWLSWSLDLQTQPKTTAHLHPRVRVTRTHTLEPHHTSSYRYMCPTCSHQNHTPPPPRGTYIYLLLVLFLWRILIQKGFLKRTGLTEGSSYTGMQDRLQWAEAQNPAGILQNSKIVWKWGKKNEGRAWGGASGRGQL